MRANAGAEPVVTIIVVDDHGDWRDTIVETIQDLGLDKAILTAGSLAELDKLLLTVTPGILVLDAMLPDGDAFTRIAHLRTCYPSMGIIMLTGRLLSEDKVSGLSLGADHYLTKPVNLAELGATLVSLSRRLRVVPATGADDAPSDTWRFDPSRRTLVSPERISVELTDTESRLIGALIQAAPLPLSRGRLVEALGASVDAYDTHRLDAHMHRLRRKLRALAGGDMGIRTVYGVGYVCTTPVQVVGNSKL
ncbi:response regulator receiver domain protein [Achromobacter piechaudii ATCC 43553]|uniref:Response regulator receiver domain protein n=1 Tax=Achromobacter piechaudii ATCC 43553 TaxID=742159 RepID=D4XDH9_9BURK|nr:response regulator receiver domain protein [Achromobacter piechaudii ATCC 43553]